MALHLTCTFLLYLTLLCPLLVWFSLLAWFYLGVMVTFTQTLFFFLPDADLSFFFPSVLSPSSLRNRAATWYPDTVFLPGAIAETLDIHSMRFLDMETSYQHTSGTNVMTWRKNTSPLLPWSFLIVIHVIFYKDGMTLLLKLGIVCIYFQVFFFFTFIYDKMLQ